MTVIKVSQMSKGKRRTMIAVTLPFLLVWVALSGIPATLKGMYATAASAVRNW